MARQQYPAILRWWDNAWSEFLPFLDNDVEIRRVICSTNAVQSINARYRRAVRARGHFPTEQVRSPVRLSRRHTSRGAWLPGDRQEGPAIDTGLVARHLYQRNRRSSRRRWLHRIGGGCPGVLNHRGGLRR
jgi:hypothetical protein